MTEGELIDQARRGDHDAFGALVDLHRAAVIRTALAALGSREDAEEVAQDAFVAAYRGLGKSRGDAKFKTWVSTIAWRRALNRRSRLGRRLERLLRRDRVEPMWREPVAPGPDAEQTIAGAELATTVRHLVASLPLGLRDALLLTANGNRRYDEAAEVLGIPVGTLKWRVAEGRRLLRTKMLPRGLIHA